MHGQQNIKLAQIWWLSLPLRYYLKQTAVRSNQGEHLGVLCTEAGEFLTPKF